MGINSLTRWGFLTAALLLVFEVRATTIQIDIFTSALGMPNGSNWDIAFDLFDGGDSVTNTVTIKDFAGATRTGNSGYPAVLGSVTGTLPGDVTLTDTAQSEYLDNVNIGPQLSFKLVISDNAPLPPAFADEFAFYFLYPGTQDVFPVNAPTGLFTFTMGADNQPETFCPDTAPRCVVVTPVLSAVPEPGALALAIAALLALCIARSRVRKISPLKGSVA